MCGRFTLTKAERAQVEDEMGLSRGSLSPGYQPRFNIAPTDEHFIVRQRFEEREVVPAKWGLINQASLLDRAQDAIIVSDLNHQRSTGIRVPGGSMDGPRTKRLAVILQI